MKKNRVPKVNVDILVVKGKNILLGLLTDKWNYNGKSVWGVPGRDIRFGEKIGNAVKRNIKEEFGCNVIKYKNKGDIPKNLFPATKNLIECYMKNKFIVSE